MRRVCVGVYAVLVWLLAHSANAVQYTIVDLGTQAVHCINEQGQIARTIISGDLHSGRLEVWDGHSWRPAPNHPSVLPYPIGINDNGEVLLSGPSPGGVFAGFSTDVVHEASMAPIYRSFNKLSNEINNQREIVGSLEAGNSRRAFVYSGGTTVDLGTLGGASSEATAINELGQVVGQAELLREPGGARNYHAFLYQNGSMRDLGSLPGFPNSRATDINEKGVIVGRAWSSSSSVLFLWSNGVMQNIGNFGGSTSDANAINDDGQVVGSSLLPDGRPRAFLYQDGNLLDLNSLVNPFLGWELEAARDINNAGQIIGSGYLDGEYRYFLLNPVPEPSTWVLAGIALVCLAAGAMRG